MTVGLATILIPVVEALVPLKLVFRFKLYPVKVVAAVCDTVVPEIVEEIIAPEVLVEVIPRAKLFVVAPLTPSMRIP